MIANQHEMSMKDEGKRARIYTMSKWWQGREIQLWGALLSTAYFLYYASTSAEWHFIDNINLLIHEAGHVIFLPFGDFLYVLGGSLFQIFFPFAFVCSFYFRQQYFSASLLLFWVGQNCINVSVYAADSIQMQLPLLSGDTSGHDWHYILSSLGLLQYTAQIGGAIFFVGVLIILTAAALSVLTSQSSR